jgi:propane monooxygenase small subunit
MFELLTNDKEFAGYNKDLIDGWLSSWVPKCLVAARQLQPLWSQPDAKPPRFEDGLDRAKSRFSGILSDLSLDNPKELTQ